MTKQEAIKMIKEDFCDDFKGSHRCDGDCTTCDLGLALTALENCPSKDSLCYGCHDNCKKCELMAMAMI